MIVSHIHRLDKTRARQVIKARKDIIEVRYEQAVALANQQLPAISEQAKGYLISAMSVRLSACNICNPSIRMYGTQKSIN